MLKIAIPDFAGDVSCSINTAYLKFVKAAGYEPVLFSQYNNIETISKLCDGLLLPGGIDVEPTFYGDNNYGSHNCKPEKDDFEREALRAFMSEDKKILGICRGFQLMVREFLHEFSDKNKFMRFSQHVNGHSLASDRNALRSTPTHEVTANTAELYGEDVNKDVSIFVNSIHHQALVANNKHMDIVVDGDNSMVTTAYTDFGTPATPANVLIVEAVDIVFSGAQLRGVQWHPEELMDVALLTTFFGEEQQDVKQPEEAKLV